MTMPKPEEQPRSERFGSDDMEGIVIDEVEKEHISVEDLPRRLDIRDTE